VLLDGICLAGTTKFPLVKRAIDLIENLRRRLGWAQDEFAEQIIENGVAKIEAQQSVVKVHSEVDRDLVIQLLSKTTEDTGPTGNIALAKTRSPVMRFPIVAIDALKI